VAVQNIIAEIKPDLIFHLAAQSSVEKSFKQPELTYKINVEGTNNIFASLINCNIKPRVLIVSSADVYGTPDKLPITEEAELHPSSPYAESRVEQEQISRRYYEEYGIPVIIARSFHHTGPGQRAEFVCSNFAKQISEIEKGAQPIIKVGNLQIKRDFSDVRDVVEAYRLLMEKGAAGEIYNVCSGKSYALREVLDILIKMTSISVKIEQEASRTRKHDAPDWRGDNSKLLALGWNPSIPFETTLKDLLDYWRKN
jgi:GDP-4-dehydro-6-deoxy-D-mannose reductase